MTASRPARLGLCNHSFTFVNDIEGRVSWR